MLNIIAGVFSEPTPPVTNSYESIATVTVGGGGSASISFSSIPSTFKHLQVRAIGRTDRASLFGDFGKLTFNSDSGANYSDHQLQGDGASVVAGAASSANFIRINRFAAATATANAFGALTIDVLDYADTNKYKTLRNLGGIDSNGSGDIFLISGNWRSTTAVNSLTITVGGGTLFNQYSQFALYGIKG
jgi:hypothetical protein